MDLFHFFTGVYSPISAIRVRKFTANNTEFSSSNKIRKKFSPPFSLSDGLNVTMKKSLCSKALLCDKYAVINEFFGTDVYFFDVTNPK